mmetsp:Transcript_12995/g.26968  ORF Transcript_12995/g.26968 Transcript_12995/m.26968 type:complete len:82 (-) Transcript_12995:222-467(-)
MDIGIQEHRLWFEIRLVRNPTTRNNEARDAPLLLCNRLKKANGRSGSTNIRVELVEAQIFLPAQQQQCNFLVLHTTRDRYR